MEPAPDSIPDVKTTAGRPVEPERSEVSRQSTSARHYLDFSSISDALSTLVSLAAEAIGFTHAVVDIVDAEHQYTLVQTDSYPGPQVIDRFHSLCDSVVRTQKPFVIPDATAPDVPEFARELLKNATMKAYVGVPLYGREGLAIGALCVLDENVKTLGDNDVRTLMRFATVVEEHLDTQRGHTRNGIDAASAAVVAAAIDGGEIVPWYQPIVDLRTGRTTGFEALARWIQPNGGVLYPDSFLGLVEESEVVIDLDLSILQSALADLNGWQNLSSDLNISVNLSGKHFLHSEGVQRIVSVTRASGMDPERVTLELTENTGLVDLDHNIDFVAGLRKYGFKVVIDDVGTGWSSLDRLVTLPVDGFKIDRSITNMLGSNSGDAMMRALAGFGHDTGAYVVAEGIETREALDRAAELGCSHGQGFLWSRPVPPRNVPQLIRP